MKELAGTMAILGSGILLFILFIIGIVYGWQSIKVYVAEQSGRAEFVRAEQNRKITVLEAEANNQAATSQAEAKVKIATAEAQAEVERAKGVAKANEIIGNSLKGNEDYLRYLYINGVTNHAGQIIYIPTEAGLPILEATRK